MIVSYFIKYIYLYALIYFKLLVMHILKLGRIWGSFLTPLLHAEGKKSWRKLRKPWGENLEEIRSEILQS